MASAALHIKDSYYFEVPKFMARSYRSSRDDFPDVWVRLDPQFLEWNAGKVYDAAGELGIDLPAKDGLLSEYGHWHHEHHGKPFAEFLESEGHLDKAMESEEFLGKWNVAQMASSDMATFKADTTDNWSEEKIDGYNHALSGKILIPQPFGRLRNLYQYESGFCISKFMIIELVVAAIIALLFIRLAQKLKGNNADAPRGKMGNFLESLLVFMRDEVARPAIGEHDANKFVPLLWTIFLFVLGCNLFGMLPWAGAPTASFSVTIAMAAVTLLTGMVCGVKKFGGIGYLKNQIPHMDLPFILAIFLKPMIFAIEVLGLFIKHGVLGIRLLANMVAGHLVLLGVMGLAFSVEGAINPSWPIAAPIAAIGSTLFSVLELAVAFLQAYIFTFLSALFIGAAIHHH